MARGKKKEELTLEEKLEKALVPMEEQPYEVPGNWCWTRIKEICEFERGITFPASAKENEETEDNIACLRTANIQDELEIDDLIYVNKEFMKNNDLKLVRKDDIIMSSANSRELVGKVSYVRDLVKPMTFGGFVLNIRAKKVLSIYLFYLLKFQFLTGKFRGESTQTTNIANINTKTLGNHCFPLPPLEEQKRIVERIENLFAKLDEAKGKLEDSIRICNERRNAILQKAYSGTLTEKWRRDHNIKVNKEKYLFEECIYKMQNGLAKRSGSVGKEYVVIRLANLSEEGFVTNDLRMILLNEKERQKYQLNQNDVVMVRVNGSKDNVARQIFVEKDVEWAFCDHIIRIKYDESKVLPKFMVYYSKSQYYRDYVRDNMVSSAGQNTISRKGMANLIIPNFTLEEQRKIINLLDEFWARENDIQKKYEIVIEQIDMIKKSVLAKAFRGELGTNNSEEENSIKLLEKIIVRNKGGDIYARI